MTAAEVSGDRTSDRQADGTAVPGRPGRRVIVGIDGSEAAGHALRWAANKAAILGEIVPAIASAPPRTFDLAIGSTGASHQEDYREVARKQLVDTVTAEAPSLLEAAMVLDHHPGPGLVETAADADLLVVGTRGHNAVAATILGSISAYCVNHSTVPVALIPPGWPASRPISTVVVGVDGSANADRALAWVADELAPHLGRDGRIVAVGALTIGADADAGYDPWLAVHEERLEAAVGASVAAATAASYAGPPMEIRLELQDPRIALPRLTAADGDLLVVGSRGTSGPSHLLLGSVADALVRHPDVATIVVPHGRTDEARTG